MCWWKVTLVCDVSGKKIFREATVLTGIHIWMDMVGTPGKSSSIYTCKNKLYMLNHIISLSLQLQDSFVVVHSLQKFQLVIFLHCYVIFIMRGRASYKAGQNLHLFQRLCQTWLKQRIQPRALEQISSTHMIEEKGKCAFYWKFQLAISYIQLTCSNRVPQNMSE